MPELLEKTRESKLGDRLWRLNHLYKIIDKHGEEVVFKMNAVQVRLYESMWWLNVIPKSRQHGITTFLAIFILDACLFNPNMKCGIIAHRLEDARKILKEKIIFAYNKLPADLKALRPVTQSTDGTGKKSADEIAISHGAYNASTIYVSTSMRSGTLNILHISEYGKLCARMPVKAQEVKTGAMNTVHEGGFIFVESTAEGPFGDFYDMCLESSSQKGALTRLDWRCHFFGWMDDIENTLEGEVEIPVVVSEYLDKIEQVYGRELTLGQRNWYTKIKKRYKHDTFKEHPSIMEECFLASVEGAYYAMEIARMRESGRICKVPHYADDLVHTVCDLGIGSHMPWIFFQVCGREIHIINEFNLGKDDAQGGAVFYRKMLDEKKERYDYQYGSHFSPSDVGKNEIGTGESILDTFAKGKVSFVELPREKRVVEGIERTRSLLSRVLIDSKCTGTIKGFSTYHREWIEALGSYSDKPKGDAASHWADAGRYMSMAIEEDMCGTGGGLTKEEWRAKKAEYGYA